MVKVLFSKGSLHPHWKGGRSLASNGYILVKVPNHPMADVRGYAYEHRLVASRKAGRPLLRAEIVRHINGNKVDNRPENLRIVRRTSGALRECACGCGRKITERDGTGRPRRFVSGHNKSIPSKIGPSGEAELIAMWERGDSVQSITQRFGVSKVTFYKVAHRLSLPRRHGTGMRRPPKVNTARLIPRWAARELMEDFDGLCAYCGEMATGFDHIVPVSRGGTTMPGNIVPCCKRCNSSKGTKWLEDWVALKNIEISDGVLDAIALSFETGYTQPFKEAS